MCQQHVSAFVYDKRGRLLSSGQNSYVKTHPLQAKIAAEVGEPHKVFLHAEVSALLKCDWKKAHRILVTRYGKDGRPLVAKPCKVCHQIISMTSIKIVEHT
ncbi:Cytidine and deoxycytidylate deaminase domain containing protein [uncultured Caudovirales phage]|uniref:Cytidine and deoxycytidylate deaminase domain containing protein n=1 Tax=uncultured Caudovirales phage TaxID=2100421 RepID=A0A6J5M317_9CAUD|nr:Cytidine and deoxycytidylate deaminase domain containing protein [uncultured Caudovirales phage]